MIDALLHDLRYAARHLRRAPAFAVGAILILALGIGANTAMFTALNALLFKRLPIKDPDTLIALTSRNQQDQLRLTLIPVVTALEREGPLHTPCALNGGGVIAADVGGVPTQSAIALVTGRCFEMFGVNPILGRTITNEDVSMTGPGRHVAVIGHGFWTRMFGADPNVLGKTVRMEGITLEVVGVMPAGFVGVQIDSGIDVFVPFHTVLPKRPERPAGAAQILGRLKPGVSFEQARAEFGGRWAALVESSLPSTLVRPERDLFTDVRVRVERFATGVSSYREQFVRPIAIVLGLTSALLLLACINLGGLLLSRLAARESELGVRLALGGSRLRIAQQMLIEGLLLSITGALLAMPTSYALVAVLVSFMPTGLVATAVSFRPDGTVLAATAAIGALSGLLISSVPVWLGWRRRAALNHLSDRTITRRAGRWTRGLLVAQIALSVVMLSGAGLLIRSLHLLHQANLGLRVDRVLYVRVMPFPGAYRDIDNPSYYRALHDKLTAIPGVRAAGFARLFPRASGDFNGQPIAPIGEPFGEIRAQFETASPGFFEAIGVPLIRGRYPAWTDRATSAQVAIVSDALARALAPDGDVLGRRVRFGTNRIDQDVEIVGVVGNASMGNPRQADLPVFYRPMLQTGAFANYPSLVIATHGDPGQVSAAARETLKESGREYAHAIQMLGDVFEQAPSTERMTATVSGAIAVLAVALAFIGIYGVLAYSVSRRTREIGVRVALGAERGRVLRMVMREGLVVTTIGMAVGIPCAILAGRVLRTMLFGVTETNPFVLGLAAAFFILVGAAAGIVPAMRAAAVDPAITLRTE
jgi:putative ABC transport system permease protein